LIFSDLADVHYDLCSLGHARLNTTQLLSAGAGSLQAIPRLMLEKLAVAQSQGHRRYS
jgi:hypothetical protein